MAEKPLYTIEFSRDFTLATIETWGRAEAINDKIWTKEKNPYLPYIIMEKLPKTANGFYDARGIRWITEKLVEKAKADPSFFKFLEDKLSSELKKIDPFLKSKQPLNLNELRDFLKQCEQLWTWFEAAWWLWMLSDDNEYGLLIPKHFRQCRDDTQDFIPYAEDTTRKSLSFLYPRLSEHVDVIRVDEIMSGKIPEKEELVTRSKGYFSLEDKLFVGVDRKFIEDRYGIKFEEPSFDADISEVKGQIAYKGNVKGRVKVIFSAKDNSLVEQGDILVSTMTLPDFLPAMKRAGAIVTDEGGVACHAAIIAREMKKPCVISTKIATKVLKDGDLVEVDANKGVVKIIKNNE